MPPDHDESVVYAVRAIATGTANDGQQLLFWRYLNYVCASSDEFQDMSFRPAEHGGDRDTCFAEGKRFAGAMIRKLLRPEFTPGPLEDAKQSTHLPRLPAPKRKYTRRKIHDQDQG
jgi:hypothetical protein